MSLILSKSRKVEVRIFSSGDPGNCLGVRGSVPEAEKVHVKIQGATRSTQTRNTGRQWAVKVNQQSFKPRRSRMPVTALGAFAATWLDSERCASTYDG